METRTEIDPEELQKWLEEGRPVEVIDIRPGADYQAWHIPGSRNIDAYDAIHARSPGPLASYRPPAEVPVILVCFVGQTSRIASYYLRSKGIPAASLAGGMQGWSLAWNTAEVPLEKSKARLIQVRRTGKGCLSYLIGSQGEALVIDPSVDPQVYLDMASNNGWQITKVLDTHIHADHLSRSRELAEAAGAVYFLPRQDRAGFDYRPIEDGETVSAGEARLVALHTPGHTLESTSYLLDGEALFTGDTLFLESIGRPDLKASLEETKARAHFLYQTLKKITSLDPELLILPAHTGKPVPFDHQPLASPLRDVIGKIDALGYDEDRFVSWIINRIPPTPPNYEEIVSLNEAGQFPDFDPAELEAGGNQCAI